MLVLDLFCCEGGASEGYFLGKLDILAGIDSEPKHSKIYDERFGCGHTMDWRKGLAEFGSQADLIHASPPCQRYSSQSRDRAKARERWDDFIPLVREALQETRKPYVIENVAGSTLINPVRLNGFMFPDELQSDWLPEWSAERVERDARADPQRGTLHWKACPCTDHPAYWHDVVPKDDVPKLWTIKRERFFEVFGFTLVPLPERRDAKREVMSVTVSGNPTMVWNKINRQSVPLWVRQEVMGGVDWMTARGVGECVPPPYTREIARQFLVGVDLGA